MTERHPYPVAMERFNQAPAWETALDFIIAGLDAIDDGLLHEGEFIEECVRPVGQWLRRTS